MREHGATVFKTQDIHIELGPAPAAPLRSPDSDAPRTAPKRSEYGRLLFAATEGIPDDDEVGQ
jgi:hypothetical protein